MNSFTAELYRSFRTTNGYAITAIGTIATVATFYFTPDTLVAVKWLILPGSATVMIIIALFDLAIRAVALARHQLPTVISAIHSDEQPLLLLLTPSTLFGVGAAVSIFHANAEGWEILIGVGKVSHIQADDKIQVLVATRIANSGQVWGRVAQRDVTELQRLRVKPFAAYEAITEGNDLYAR